MKFVCWMNTSAYVENGQPSLYDCYNKRRICSELSLCFKTVRTTYTLNNEYRPFIYEFCRTIVQDHENGNDGLFKFVIREDTRSIFRSYRLQYCDDFVQIKNQLTTKQTKQKQSKNTKKYPSTVPMRNLYPAKSMRLIIHYEKNLLIQS